MQHIHCTLFTVYYVKCIWVKVGFFFKHDNKLSFECTLQNAICVIASSSNWALCLCTALALCTNYEEFVVCFR